MRVSRMCYNLNGTLISGHLIERFLRRPIFYPHDRKSPRVVYDRSALVKDTDEAIRAFYKETYPKGTLIKVVSMVQDPRPVPSGTKGFVLTVDDMCTIHCRFENGRHLGLIPGVDRFVKLKETVPF